MFKHITFIFSVLTILIYNFQSYALTNSWCSSGKYGESIIPFPQPSSNRCPKYAKIIMSNKEVEDYFFNGLGLQYFCNLAKKPLFFVWGRRME